MWSHTIWLVSLRECNLDLFSFNTVVVQVNFSHFIGFKVVSYSAQNLTNGDYISLISKKLRCDRGGEVEICSVLVEMVDAAL